ncbi:TetR/AcrR family transcriptional regulator [Actinosynnema sp. NPDC050436]|uniref:TetR/AcrR family transcriptional regulator n=1 Tax=Actinosynnema sp. NPDC050436 TaxID=3155659 RepID=UPI00340C7716
MPIHERRERERADRHRLIIDSARDLAEAEGWEAVTTRRLAERVEYSQPVLYSHFKGKDAIVRAVAVDGFGVLAGLLRGARSGVEGAAALRAVAEAYLDFAAERPALYDAMFVQRVEVPFGTSETPDELRAAFGEFMAAVTPVAGQRDPETLVEVFWSALHGLATLTAGHRLRPDHHRARLELVLTGLLN